MIGGPLVAGIEAQVQAAKSTVDFILQVGFEDPFRIKPPGKSMSLSMGWKLVFRQRKASLPPVDSTVLQRVHQAPSR